MIKTSGKSSRVIFIVLRFMRTPIMALVAVYAVSMLGWVMIPGQTPDGQSERLSFFHAFYFLTYTATTTGFGEIPHPFSNAQRMWGIVSLYGSVIAWLYAVGAIIRLVQNPFFQQAVAERRFAKSVARLSEPFLIICGFGSTGSLLARGLSDAGMTAVILDKDPERIKALYLRDYRVAMPGLQADARIPDHLIEAGLMSPDCTAVVALTHDEQVNLKIAVTARLLNPKVRVVNQSTSEAYEEVLATLGGEIHVIDPFQTYAKYLAATIQTPALHTLSQWLSGSPDARLDTEIPPPPKGPWIVCGYGRMGRWIHHSLESLGLPTTVIEPDIDPDEAEAGNIIMARANQASLQAAGIKEAAGVIAGTDSDSDNLSIQINAKALNPKVFVIVRQNQHRNEVVFQAAHAGFIMQPSLVSARRILFLLMAPLLKTFFEDLRGRSEAGDEAAVPQVMECLQQTVGGTLPRLWNLDIKQETASALVRMSISGRRVCLGDLLRDPVDRDGHLACLALVIVSGEKTVVMPDDSQSVRPGDQVLFCGSSRAVRLLDATLNNEYTLRYLMTGRDEIRSTVLRWLFGKLRGEAVEETVEVAQ